MFRFYFFIVDDWDGCGRIGNKIKLKKLEFYNFSSLATLEAMFLNPIEVPEIRLKRTPFRESRGSLQTSISHWTRESVFGSPWTQRRRNFSRCS